jgi:hypothetical protein
VLRAAGETETTQTSIQDWLQLDEGGPGFQFLTEEEIAALIFFIFFSSALILHLLAFFLCFTAIFCFINPDFLFNPDDSSKLTWISKGLLMTTWVGTEQT